MNVVRTLLLYDAPGWAWYHRAMAVQEWLRNERIQVSVRQRGAPITPEDFDFVVMFGPYALPALTGLYPEQVILGAANPYEVSSVAWAIEHGVCFAGLVNSAAMFEQLREPGRVFLCQNGVDTILFSPDLRPTRELVACWVGNARSQNNKGLDIIREACRQTGTPFLPLDVDAEVGQSPVLAPTAVRDRIYRRSSFYVCMSEYEGTPNPALEALACGLPVISTRVGNMPEILVDGENGFLVDRSVEALVSAIGRLRNADYSRMSALARESVVPEWTWEHQVAKYETMFLKAADLRRAEPVHRNTSGVAYRKPLELSFLEEVDLLFWRMRQDALRVHRPADGRH